MHDALIVICGATGDLTQRKLIPALYELIRHNKLGNFAIVGVARDTATMTDIIASSKQHIQQPDEKIIQSLINNSYYYQLDLADDAAYTTLATAIGEIEQKHNLPGNRMLYLATSSQLFCEITTGAATHGIINKGFTKKPWQRIVYEKPFGHNKESAHAINACILAHLDPAQAFIIDHYLAKEVVGNIALLRFTNRVLEPLWNRHNIDNVQIILSEDLTIGTRGSFYDKQGALNDVVQNHMLQILALIAMEAPQRLSGNFIKDKKIDVLRATVPVSGMLAQYNGYLKTPQVQPNSRTETYAILELQVNNNRWCGVPFYIKTGKALTSRTTVIHVTFKAVECLLDSCPREPNSLTISVMPEAGFSLRLNAKKPGVMNEVVPVAMEFFHRAHFGPATTAGYEILFEEIMKGERSIAVGIDEIEYQWDIIDKVHAMGLPLYYYEPGSTGPAEAEAFAQQHNMQWFL